MVASKPSRAVLAISLIGLGLFVACTEDTGSSSDSRVADAASVKPGESDAALLGDVVDPHVDGMSDADPADAAPADADNGGADAASCRPNSCTLIGCSCESGAECCSGRCERNVCAIEQPCGTEFCLFPFNFCRNFADRSDCLPNPTECSIPTNCDCLEAHAPCPTTSLDNRCMNSAGFITQTCK
jgi:hypothetical protein